MCYLKTLALVLLAMSPVILLQVHSKPDTPPPAKKPELPTPPKIPDIAGPTNWGTIYQLGRVLRVEGSPSWIATSGEIIGENRVHLKWTCISDGRPANGSYLVIGKDLVGRWGWEDETSFDDQGELFGNWNSETLHPVK